MHLYAKIMRRAAPFASAAEELADLRQVLADCPAVRRVKSIEPHGGGGYAVMMEFSMGHRDDFIERLVRAGWCCVV